MLSYTNPSNQRLPIAGQLARSSFRRSTFAYTKLTTPFGGWDSFRKNNWLALARSADKANPCWFWRVGSAASELPLQFRSPLIWAPTKRTPPLAWNPCQSRRSRPTDALSAFSAQPAGFRKMDRAQSRLPRSSAATRRTSPVAWNSFLKHMSPSTATRSACSATSTPSKTPPEQSKSP